MPDPIVERAALSSLTPHPRNYREHPEDQLAHIMQSLREHGFYRNVVVARDGTILAGHGVVQAAQQLGLEDVPVVRLPIDRDDPRALKVLAGDNEMSRSALVDDRALTTLLKQIMDEDPIGLLGTGFDEMQLAALVMVTRPEDEVRSFDEAAEWVGMPEFSVGERILKMFVSFASDEDFVEFCERNGFGRTLRAFREETRKHTYSSWYPEKENTDLSAVGFEETDDGGS